MKGLNEHIYRDNGNAKTVCVSHVLVELGISPISYKNTYNKRTDTQSWQGVIRRNGFSLRSRKSSVNKTIGSSRKKIQNLKDSYDTLYVAWVVIGTKYSHLILLDRNGDTIVDTDPRKNDKRQIHGIWAVKKVK